MALDNRELEGVMAKLESMQDEELAVKLLAEFNKSTSALGRLLMNLDPSLSHEDWKKKCDEAREKVDEVIRKIEQQA